MNKIPWGNNENLDNDQFYNRSIELSHLKQMLLTTEQETPPNILLTGNRGIGKTVFIKKIQKELEEHGFLVIYVNFSQAECFRRKNMTIKGLMQFYFKKTLMSCNNNKLKNISEKLKKYFKTNNFHFKEFQEVKGMPIPIFKSELNTEDLMEYVLTFPEKIYNDNSNELKGVIILIDEFQLIKELDDYKESFLWKLRSYVQNQNYVSYVFSGSMSMQDELISEIASQRGAFGGRMLTINISPFSKETVKAYLTQEAPNLKFSDEGFDRFFKCTSGIPAYVNIFATLLPKDIELNENIVKLEFEEKIKVINSHLIVIWDKLTLREQYIIISLIDGPLKRNEIAKTLNVTTGSISKPLVNLQHQELVSLENNSYYLSEPILKRWLELEFDKTGTYPFRLD